jgi:hypothetical protein
MEATEPTVSIRVVRAVARTTNRDQTELPLLYDSVDPEALNTLVSRMSDGEVSFSYAGCEVTVTSDGTVRVEKRMAVGATASAPAHSD